jgi:peptide deformylase
MIIKKSEIKLVGSTEEVLLQPPEPFKFDGEIDPVAFSNVLFEKMRDYHGLGLSANQVGLNLRAFVIGNDDFRLSVFNPEIVNVSDDMILMEEGCLSFPGVFLKVQRPTTIKVRYQNTKGELMEEDYNGLTARIFLHEYDHMQGITMQSRVSKLKWDMATKKVVKKTKKIIKKHVQQNLNNIKNTMEQNGNPQRIS